MMTQTSSLAVCPGALPGPEQRQEMWSKEAARGQTLPHHRVPGSFLSQPSAILSPGLPRRAHHIPEFLPVVTNYTADE